MGGHMGGHTGEGAPGGPFPRHLLAQRQVALGTSRGLLSGGELLAVGVRRFGVLLLHGGLRGGRGREGKS
eukprot:6391674-Prymnesium_polylepis.1